MPKPILIIAAMELEVAPLLRRWRKKGRTIRRAKFGPVTSYICGNTNVLVSGIGGHFAASAVEEWLKPPRAGAELIISAGLAGGLARDLNAGDVVRPAKVVDGKTGRAYATRDTEGNGVLVTADSVLSADEKRALARRYQAQVIDMEAAAVAQVAAGAGVPFLAVKAVSDPFDFAMPPLDRFIGPEGKLDLLHLMGWAALRPAVWRALVSLGRNSRKAAEELARELERILAST